MLYADRFYIYIIKQQFPYKHQKTAGRKD